jgi:hypothetical protein
MPFVLLAVLRRFLPPRWAIALALIFVAIPLGAVFGTSFFHYASMAARGYADSAAYILFVCAVVPIIGATAAGPSDRFGSAFGCALLMVLAITMKPIVAPAAGVLLAGAGLAALSQGQWRRIAGLCLGFVPVGAMALHNWYFGGVFVPFSSNADHPLVLVMPPSAYAEAFAELAHGQTGERVARMLRHLTAWLSGPSGAPEVAPLGAVAIVVLLYVVLVGRRFDSWLRLLALAALAQQAVGLFYIATARYHLLAWLLTVIVAAVWFRQIGVPWMQRRWPKTWQRAATHRATVRVGHWLALLQWTCDMRDQSARVPEPAKA